MGDLKTLMLFVFIAAGPAWKWVEHLFEERVRIHKVLMVISGPTTAANFMHQGLLTKHKVEEPFIDVAHKSVGHIAFLECKGGMTTSGGQMTSLHEVFDFTPHWIQVEEDNFIYLGAYCDVSSGYAFALIFYEEL